jgi:hypothetical protein
MNNFQTRKMQPLQGLVASLSVEKRCVLVSVVAYLYIPSGVYAVMFAVVFTLLYCCCAVESK